MDQTGWEKEAKRWVEGDKGRRKHGRADGSTGKKAIGPRGSCALERTCKWEETNKRCRVPVKGRVYGDGGEGEAGAGRSRFI